MKINIKELGAIKEGTIDLSKKLNVFCGPNGTGKTYVAYVIYALMKAGIHFGRNDKLATELIDKKQLIFEIDYALLYKYRSDLQANLKSEYDTLFGIGKELASHYFENTVVSFAETETELRDEFYWYSFKKQIIIGNIEIQVVKETCNNYLDLTLTDKTISTKDIEYLGFVLQTLLLSLCATYPIGSTYILPVERNSIFTFSKELSIRKQEAFDHFNALTNKEQKVDKFDLFFKKNTRYPLPIKDGLLIADDLSEIKKKNSEFYEFATELENELLHGKVQITSEGELQFKSDKAPKKLLPIHMTASIIKSLSSLVVYLKHIASKNDLIIIDEPEINLHPDNQILLVRLFARLINKGFRLLISTHSDYVVRELNNIIMLSSDKQEVNSLREKFGYKTEESISKDDIAVYYFNYPSKGRNIKQVNIEIIEIDDSGFEIPSVDATIDAQNNVSEELFYALKYNKSNE